MTELTDSIPYRILIINECVDRSREDQVFMHCMQLAFDWANRMGLENKRVFGMHLEDCSKNDPLKQQMELWCRVDCTEEQRNHWDAMRRLEAGEL